MGEFAESVSSTPLSAIANARPLGTLKKTTWTMTTIPLFRLPCQKDCPSDQLMVLARQIFVDQWPSSHSIIRLTSNASAQSTSIERWDHNTGKARNRLQFKTSMDIGISIVVEGGRTTVVNEKGRNTLSYDLNLS